MIKTIAKLLLSLIVLLSLVIAIGIGIAMQTGLLSKSDMRFLVDLGQREGAGAVISVIKAEFYGVDTSNSGDPSYGREPVEGRGHAPWVIRGNLDDRPRMLKFALRQELWAAYDTQTMSLYQVWQGSVLFAGAAYDYRHGPQPASEGAWYLRDEEGARWFVLVDGEEIPATVRYLGHEYSTDRRTAAMRFSLTAGDIELELTERPDVIERDGGLVFTREFRSADGNENFDTGFYTGGGERHLAQGTLEIALDDTTTITPIAELTRGREAGDGELSLGESVIANGDCLGCHAAHHRVAGPAWSQISGKFRAKLQDSVIESLTRSVLEGSVGTWGTVPMPPHAQMSEEEARAAVAFILSTGEPEDSANPPLDEQGQPYPATLDYDVLPRLSSLHPSLQLEDLAPAGFDPKVGGMDFREDGKLVVASWDRDGAVFLIDPDAPEETRVKRIAEGLHEPLGLTIVGERLFVLQKQELTELIDRNGDGTIEQYRAVSHDWPSNANFHSFAFGLLHQDDTFYFLLSICVLPGGASCTEQLPTQGKLLRADLSGKTEVVASGFRTPNGIAFGAGKSIYVTDNQGDWLPASKLVRIEEDGFYGSRAVSDPGVMELSEIPPVAWLPQDEVGNSPTQPLLLRDGPYAGQMLHGDVYNGGIKRVFIEQVEGSEQGAVFHFSAGFKGSVNRLEYGPDGAIYVGEIGNPPNWGEYGKPWYGLERIRWTGNKAFEMRAVRVTAEGFELELTQPLAGNISLSPSDLLVRQWFYRPDEQYGGPKYNETQLFAATLKLSPDRRRIHARIPGLRTGYVVYLRLDDRLRSAAGQNLWASEAWYTLNNIPGGHATTGDSIDADGWRTLFDGETLSGWRNYGGNVADVRKWQVQDDTLALVQSGPFPLWDLISSVIFGGGSSDLIYYPQKFRNFELSLEWKISENGNSGIFYLVADEEENTPWLTGLEMQVLHNEGHSDGQIDKHRAGDLYDLIAAEPVTVRPPGEWNEVRIQIKDNLIEHWLNGTKVVSVIHGDDDWDALVAGSKFAGMPRFGKSDNGYIVLQDHGDPVWYRNIRVRELD